MAPPGQLRVSRYFIALFVLIAGLYALVFFTGPSGSLKERLTPKLGLDLQGGTTVTLRASLPNGERPDRDRLKEARDIISNRVNGSGVAEAEVLIEGNRNIVINVPGKNDEDLKKIGDPAELRFRQVLNQTPAEKVKPVDAGNASNATAPPREQVVAKFSPAAQQAVAEAATSKQPVSLDDPTLAAEFEVVKTLTPAEIAALPADFQYYIPTISCEALNRRPPGSIADPKEQVVSCRGDDTTKMLLEKAEVVGSDVRSASFGFDPQRGWVTSIKFDNKGQDKWTNLTKKSVGQQVAIVLDNVIVSDPNIEEVISGDAQISGSGISKAVAKDIANKLKYGALRVTFTTDNAYEVSPTLGIAQLKAGLLAGGIGVALVVLYALLYYRSLGLVLIASLAVAGAIVYAMLLLLGRQMGFTLTLAGVAGFIVSLGITADSSVVLFERLKDEVKEGRSPRSAVPRAWARSRRAIVSANAVTIMAAAVLYILAIGAVKGFAFTLGLSTAVDLLVLFLFTHPLVVLFARSKKLTSPRISGLVRDDRPTRTARPPAEPEPAPVGGKGA